MRYINDNRCVYYYFHRDGGIGDLYLDQDDLEWTLEELQAIARDQATTRKQARYVARRREDRHAGRITQLA